MMKDEGVAGANILDKFFCAVRVLGWWKLVAAGGLGKLTLVSERSH